MVQPWESNPSAFSKCAELKICISFLYFDKAQYKLSAQESGGLLALHEIMSGFDFAHQTYYDAPESNKERSKKDFS